MEEEEGGGEGGAAGGRGGQDAGLAQGAWERERACVCNGEEARFIAANEAARFIAGRNEVCVWAWLKVRVCMRVCVPVWV